MFHLHSPSVLSKHNREHSQDEGPSTIWRPGLKTPKVVFKQKNLSFSNDNPNNKKRKLSWAWAVLNAIAFLWSQAQSLFVYIQFYQGKNEAMPMKKKVTNMPKHHQHLQHITQTIFIFPVSAICIPAMKHMFTEHFWSTVVQSQPSRFKPLLKKVWVSETQSPPVLYNALCCKSFRTLSQQVV